jgi:hypothetical protein
MRGQSDPDSGLGHWNRYRDVDLEKTVESEGEAYCMFLITLAGKSYKLEHNSRKMRRKVLRFSRQLYRLKKVSIEELF